MLERSAELFLRPPGVREVIAGAGIRSADELRALVDEAEGAGVIPRAQEQLLHNVFDFPARGACDVMVPPSTSTGSTPTCGPRRRSTGFARRRIGATRWAAAASTAWPARSTCASSSPASATPEAAIGDSVRSAYVVPETKRLGPRTLGGLVFDALGPRPPHALVAHSSTIRRWSGVSGGVSPRSSAAAAPASVSPVPVRTSPTSGGASLPQTPVSQGSEAMSPG